jgi:hypothetical protein
MFPELDEAVATVRRCVGSLDVDPMTPDGASRLVGIFAELERLAIAGRTFAGRRVERSRVWQEEGFGSPARWMAAKAQTSIAEAISTIETGRRIEELPATREALLAGALSHVQAAEITAAASADPAAERSLLDAAKHDSVARLRDRCRQVVAAASRDADADERIHRSRYFRSWSDADGAFRMDARLTPDAGARLAAVIQARARRLRDAAKKGGSVERAEAYDADALASLADGDPQHPRAVVHVHVDRAAWNRGRVERGESCAIPGFGPISVAAARRLARDGIVKAVLTEDAEVRAVASFGRTITAKLRTALEARDTTCVVPGCDVSEGLEIDHVLPLAEGGPTSIENLARLCRWHHSLKTHRGWRLAGQPGDWRWFRQKRGGTFPSLN